MQKVKTLHEYEALFKKHVGRMRNRECRRFERPM